MDGNEIGCVLLELLQHCVRRVADHEHFVLLIADARFDGGFVLTGCGLMLCLDESTALAMRDALNVGIAHLRDRRAPARSIAA